MVNPSCRQQLHGDGAALGALNLDHQPGSQLPFCQKILWHTYRTYTHVCENMMWYDTSVIYIYIYYVGCKYIYISVCTWIFWIGICICIRLLKGNLSDRVTTEVFWYIVYIQRDKKDCEHVSAFASYLSRLLEFMTTTFPACDMMSSHGEHVALCCNAAMRATFLLMTFLLTC